MTSILRRFSPSARWGQARSSTLSAPSSSRPKAPRASSPSTRRTRSTSGFPDSSSIDVPAGAFRGRPPTPDDTVTTLAVTYRFVAPNTMLDVVAGAIARSIFTTKAQLVAKTPLASQIEAPDPDDKNPVLPVHPGVAAYLSSGEQSFFDEFQKYFYLGGIALSLAGSAIALLVGRLNRKKSESDLRQIDRLIELADKALTAQASSNSRPWRRSSMGLLRGSSKDNPAGPPTRPRFPSPSHTPSTPSRNNARRSGKARQAPYLNKNREGFVQFRRARIEPMACGDQAAIANNHAIKMLTMTRTKVGPEFAGDNSSAKAQKHCRRAFEAVGRARHPALQCRRRLRLRGGDRDAGPCSARQPGRNRAVARIGQACETLLDNTGGFGATTPFSGGRAGIAHKAAHATINTRLAGSPA